MTVRCAAPIKYGCRMGHSTPRHGTTPHLSDTAVLRRAGRCRDSRNRTHPHRCGLAASTVGRRIRQIQPCCTTTVRAETAGITHTHTTAVWVRGHGSLDSRTPYPSDTAMLHRDGTETVGITHTRTLADWQRRQQDAASVRYSRAASRRYNRRRQCRNRPRPHRSGLGARARRHARTVCSPN